MTSSLAVAPRPERTIPFLTLPAWVHAAKRCGFDIEPVLHELGLELDLVHLEATRIRETSLQQLMLACVPRAREHHFPFVLGQTLGFDYLPELQTFLRTSPTPRHALRAFLWIRGLLNPHIGVRLEEQDELAWLWLEFAGVTAEGRAGVYFSEARVVMMQNLARIYSGTSASLARVWFRHSAPPYAAAYASYLDAAVVEFDRPEDGLAFPRAALDLPLEGGHPLLHRQAELRLAQRLQRAPHLLGVSARMARAFASDPALMSKGIQGVARRLGVHPRTLQRRLREEGDNFVELLARLRMQLASGWLRDRCDIDTIATRLGYSDRRSFSRAFTRWAGVSPSHFRRLESLPDDDREAHASAQTASARRA